MPTKEGRSAPRFRPLRRAAQAVLGVAVGLAVAEGAFNLRDHGAFPHLNVYVADPVLGVRLAPGATEKLSYGGNPVDVDPHRRGRPPRRRRCGPPAEGEILVVGDSQVFGLGVEENETAAAQLADVTGRPVVNAGVPTYGPPEYARAARRAPVPRRRPRTVVYVVNFANDLFEAHAARTPSATRSGTAGPCAARPRPSTSPRLPGRALLYGKSHLVYALRPCLPRARAELDERGFASEGRRRPCSATPAGSSTRAPTPTPRPRGPPPSTRSSWATPRAARASPARA